MTSRSPWMLLIGIVVSQASFPVMGQDAPNWSAGLVWGENFSPKDSRGSDLGPGGGIEICRSWKKTGTFQSRLRLNLVYLSEGEGGFDSSTTNGIPISWKFYTKGALSSLSWDWKYFPFGPARIFLIGGVGVGATSLKSRYLTMDPTGQDPRNGKWTEMNDDGAVLFIPTLGVGMPPWKGIEVELKASVEDGSPFESFGHSVPDRGGSRMLWLSIRKTF